MFYKLLTALGILASTVTGCAATAAQSVTPITGIASDHSHIVSQAEFLRVLRGNGAPTTNYQMAYQYTVDTCNVVMRARPQDRQQLSSVYPASIQDPILRSQVYTAVFSGKVCKA